MAAKLYVILGSHACRTGMLMLEHKGIRYRPVVLPTGLHPFALRLLGFAGNKAAFRRVDDRPHRMLGVFDRLGTVPTLRIDDQLIATNRAIARYLDSAHRDPTLFPAEPDRRHAVEEAERWGDEVFQMTARRLVLAASLRGRKGLVNAGADGRLGPLLFRNTALRLAGARLFARLPFAANARAEGELLPELPGMLDRIDAWIDAGVLNGQELNAADFIIAPSLALLSYRPDLRPEIGRRPALDLVDRLLPEP